ncbi:signal peptide peptidase A. Serine peptidase. MEROPS family S49 [Desulfocicer vacuolatum DSM 3385]|uniref:Signal peptide peptidase A. Serine peptidase. MEROPS family S49 n=1 Tax=Desulfocicer vacuolatum DSM 3385 TaxID=1121400 RepID=A0A1W2E4P0_9BACT|nr:signal peptide peptidase SppA [Desulfocicer vacuolatum]SMD04008.1 signal peptide peptidase A. Serine peptidase. MEROPS family S49 [Desulfocicer vacuolatum DSM 3385]
MFSRRHPFLFFSLVSLTVVSATFVIITGLIVGGGAMFKASLGTEYGGRSGNVGVVEISGLISSSKEVIEDIKAFRKDADIKAIVLRINSPGGGVGPSQEIYREVMKTRLIKKVVASLGSVAASGGYYSAAACDGIMANPGTITGSIGVIMEYANFKNIIKKIGLTPVVIKSGEYKDMGSPLRDLGDKEKRLLQGVVDEIHSQFVKDVAMGRNMDEEKMATLADGRIFTGARALDLQLVDRLGNLGDAIEWAGVLADISGDVVPVYPREDNMTVIKKVIQSLFKNADITGAITDNFGFVVN